MKLTKKSLSIPYKMTFSPSFYYVYSLKNLSTHLTKEYEHSIQETHRENFWLNQSHSLSWFKAPSHILTIERQVSGPQGIKGDKVLTFADGLINMCYNCLDRHLMPHNQTAAIIYAKSPSDFITINYYELFNKVNNLASHLKNIQKLNVGDTVMIYMPHAPEAIFAMLACARLGIIYNIIPSTIDAEALGDKIQQFNPKLVITTQETRSSINFLSNLNKAFSAISFINIKTLILKSDHESQLKSSNEKFKGPLEILELSNNKLSSIECVSLPASHPISLNETSGTEGLPRGVYRDTAGLAVYLNWLMKNTFEFDARNVFFCSPGFSWTYGQNYGVYGPLLLGGTTFLYDGDWTDPEIYWKLLSNYKINGFLTFPSLLAHIKQMDIKGKIIQSYDYSALKTMTLTGERCDSSMFNWLKNNINGTTKVIDAYMQQETGFPIFHSQGENPTLGLGFDVTLAQFSDKDLKTGTHMGQILLSLPLPPGCVGNCSEKVFNQEIAVNNKGKYYRTGDLGYINEDGKVEVCREEDIITVGEYEFSSRVIEEQLNYHRFVKEIAVVAGLEIKEDNLKNIVQKKRVYVKGRGLLMKKETILENENLPVAFIVLKPNVQIPSDELSNEMIHLIKNEVSPLLSLRKIIVVKELPRNINGMVLKRLLNDMCLKKRYQLPKNIVNRECIKDIEEIKCCLNHIYCYICPYNSTDPNYESSLLISLNQDINLNASQCVLKNYSFILTRNIVIRNSINCPECLLRSYDSVYDSLPEAFQSESQFSSNFLNSNLNFFLQSGSHYVFQKDFFTDGVQLFRRILANIRIQNLSPGFVSIYLKTNRFYLFVSKNLIIENIDFFGNDINFNENEPCMISNNTICCSESALNSELNFSSQNKGCGLKGSISFDNDQSIDYGLINLEYIFDNPNILEKPKLILNNCSFQNFYLLTNLNGFGSVVMLNYFSGSIEINNLNLLNVYFVQSFIFYSHSDYDLNIILQNNLITDEKFLNNIANLKIMITITNSKIRNFNLLQIKNAKTSYIDNFATLLNYNGDLFFENSTFDLQFENSFIFKIISLDPNVGNYYFKNSNFSRIYNSSLIFVENANYLFFELIYFSECSNLKSELLELANVNLIDFKNSYLINILASSIISLIKITKSNTKISDSFFINNLANSIFLQTSNNLTLINCTFDNISFSDAIIIFKKGNILNSINLVFKNIIGTMAIFYSSESNQVILDTANLKKVRCYSIFFLSNALQNIAKNFYLSQSQITLIWSSLQTCFVITLNKAYITLNVFALFFNNFIGNSYAFNLKSVYINDNNFTNSAMIRVISGLMTFDNLFLINNFFLNTKLFQMILNFAKATLSAITNCYFENNGVIEKKTYYVGLTENCFFSIGLGLKYSIYDNIIMVASNKIEMVSGFFSGDSFGNLFQLTNSRLIILSANPSFGYKGIYMTDFLNAYVSNNTFYNLLCNTKSKAHMHGSVAFLGTSASYSYSKNTKSIYFINNTFYNCNCIYGGSLAIIGLKFVTIENCFFYNSSATKAGGHLVLIAGEQFLLKNIYMNHSSALKEGGGMFLQNIYNVSIENLTIFNALSEKNGAIFCRFIINFSLKNLLSQNTSALNGGFLYFMKGTANLTNLYVSSSIADYFGGAIYTDGFSNLYLKNGSFEKCGADNGGTFNIENSEKIIINQCKIISCSANLKGGAFLIKSIYLLNIIDIIFENNVVSNGIGIFLIENDDESASIEIKNVKCLNNLAMKGSCIYYISSTPLNLQTIQINDCKDIPILITWFFPININISELIISDINADSNLFFLMESHINFDNFTFKNNNLSKHLMEFNTITGLLKNIRFENNSNSKAFNFYQSDILISMFSLVNDENFFNKLGFFSSISSNLNFNDGNIDNSYDFSNNIANFTGGNLILKNTTFTNSRGQILVLSISNLFLSHCFFMNNSNNGNLKGNDINFINPQSKLFQIVILNTNFYVMSESSLEFDGLLNISLINSELNNINSNTTSKIFAMAALNIYQLLIRNCSFSSFSDSSLKIYSDKFSFASEMQVYIYATIFRKNKALVGSCVYIDAAGNIQFKENIFSDNIAYITDVGLKNLEGIAPAVFFKSLSGISSNISFFSCQFVNNIAEYLAPTVFSQTNIKIDNSNSFSNNKESFGNFNDKMFSFPINLKLVSYQDFEKKINFTDDLTINFVSGEKFNLTFQLVDNFDQVLFFDNLTIIIIKSYVEQDQDQSDIFVETALATCRKGEFEFKNLLIRTVVRDIFSLSFEGDLAKLTKDEKNQLISVKIKKTLHFKSRECEKGEIVLNDSSCFKCRENKYSLLDPAKTQTKYQRCYQCPQNAYCKGGSNITPHAGFYRKNENSTDVVACINPLACFGYVENASGDSLIHGECKTGNYGPLCYYCKVSYGKYQNNDYCNYCNLMMALIYVRMFLSVLFIVLNLIINVANIEKDANKNDIFNIVFKIIINHGQQIILIIRNSLSLPDFSIFVSLFDVSDFLSFIDIGSFMNQCVIHNYYYNPKQLSFFLSLFSAFIPFIIAIAALLIWLLLGLILVLGLKSTYFKNQLGFDNFPNKIFTKFLLFILLSVYMFYPMILKSSFSLMDCLYIDKNDSISYLRESPEIQCWDSEHYKYIALFSLPGLIIWGIFFPILLFFLLQKTYQKYQTITNSPDKKNKQISVVNKKKKLLKNHKNINSLKNSTVLTFFFCGYQSQFYYWESLIFLRKFSLTFVLTLDQTLEQEFKWIIVISVLTIYINITWLKSPYKLKFCNRLEMFSLVTCLISVLVAVLNEANETSIFVQIFNILCITANLVFYLAALFYILYHFLKKIKSKILMIKSKLSDKFKSIFKNKNSKIENVPRFLEKSEKIHIKEGKKLEIKNSIVLQNINE